MNNFTRSAMLFSLLIVAGVTKLFAQASQYVEPRLIVNGSAAISGIKQFNWSQNPTNTTPWGRAIDTLYYNVPLVKAYDTLGASPLLNGSGGYPSLAGKFALIIRGGGISFSQKAKYCQDAGAIGVIIVNQKNGGTIGMAPTTPFSTGTTIPVLIISKEDGFPISDALKLGQTVTISLSRWGFKLTNDLGIVSYSPATPHSFCVPLPQVNAAAGTPRAYNFYNGGHVANFGTANQTNVKLEQTLSFTPTGGSASVLNTDAVTLLSLTTLDSLNEFFSPRFKRLNFASTGVLNMTYTASSAVTDANPIDNVVNYPVYITDSIFCKSRWNAAINGPLVSVGYRFSATQPLLWGPMFYVAKGGYQPTKAQLAIAADSDILVNNTVSPSVLVYLFKWTDANSDGLVNGSELSIVATGFKSTFAATDSSYKPFLVPLTNPKNNKLVARLADNSWYFLAAELEHDFSLGADNETNFYTRSLLSHHVDSVAGGTEYWGPNTTANVASPAYNVLVDTMSNITFFNKTITQAENVVFNNLTGLVPSVALHVSKLVPTNVETNSASVFNRFEIFPNPANNTLNLDVNLIDQSTMVVSVINAMGQGLKYETYKNFKAGKLSISTASYPAGNYYLVVGTDAGTEVKAFTVSH